MKQVQQRGKKFTATIRLNGHSVSSTFPKKSQATEWLTRVEMAIRDEIVNPANVFEKARFLPKRNKIYNEKEIKIILKKEKVTPNKYWTLGDAIRHYKNTELDKLKGWLQAKKRLDYWEKHDLADRLFNDITPEDLVDWIKSRKKIVKGKSVAVSASTIRNDIARLSVLYDIAGKPKTKGGWGLDIKNPVADIQLPKLSMSGRQRRFERDEEEQLFHALEQGLDGLQMVAIITLAIETGMRRGEILNTIRAEVRQTDRGFMIIKFDTKNGHPRTIYLSDRAGRIIEKLIQNKDDKDKLFTLNGDQVGTRWDKARAMIGHPDLRLHDLRHEAVSRLADKGLSAGALASMSGHRSMQTLLRYINVSERDIRDKLGQ